MLAQFNNLFFYPPTDTPASGGTATIPSKELSKEEMFDIINDDESEDTPLPIKEEKKDEKPKPRKEKEADKEADEEDKEDKEESGDDDEEVDELKEIEEELEEPPEEKLELMTPVRRRDILKKYPTLFKEFPYLENAYYREQQFTELFSTPADAKEAKESQDTLNRFEKELVDGNIENILIATKKESPKSFNKIVDNYLDTLGKIDPGAHQHVIGNIIKTTVMAMAREGQRKGKDSKLTEAAELIYEFVFGDTEFKPPTRITRETDERDNSENEKLQKERQAFARQQFQIASEDLNNRVNTSIKKTIEANIDPKSTMTDYVRRNAIRDAMDTLTNLIDKDTRFKSLVDKLWEKSFTNSFSQTSKDAIKSAYFSKARTLLPSVIKKARNEALKGMGKRIKQEEDDSTPETEKESIARPEKKEQSHSHRTSDKSSIPSTMSTLEFLSKD